VSDSPNLTEEQREEYRRASEEVLAKLGKMKFCDLNPELRDYVAKKRLAMRLMIDLRSEPVPNDPEGFRFRASTRMEPAALGEGDTVAEAIGNLVLALSEKGEAVCVIDTDELAIDQNHGELCFCVQCFPTLKDKEEDYDVA
jgi:hypothetical protein